MVATMCHVFFLDLSNSAAKAFTRMLYSRASNRMRTSTASTRMLESCRDMVAKPVRLVVGRGWLLFDLIASR